MKQPIQCLAGTWYDAAIHVQCPCPNCWADRASARLSARENDSDKPAEEILTDPTVRSIASDQPPKKLDSLGEGLKRAYLEAQGPARPIDAAFFVGCLALISALLSFHFPLDHWSLLQLTLYPNATVPILPGCYFAFVICIAVYCFERSPKRKLFASFVITNLGWIAAWNVAVVLIDVLYEGRPSPTSALGIVLPGLAAGFVGGLITAIGVSLNSADFRRRGTWIPTVLIGTVVGALLDERAVLPKLPFLYDSGLLYLIWQPTVAASIAYGLTKPKWSKSLDISAPLSGTICRRLTGRHAVAFAVVVLALTLHGVSIVRGSWAAQDMVTFSDAQGNVEKLQKYIATCKLCHERGEALAQIEASKDAEQTQREESEYRAAHGDLGNLYAYMGGCKACAFVPAAREETDYLEASGNVELLRAYLGNCKLCEFKDAARAEIAKLEGAAQTFEFHVCNQTSYQAAVATVGRADPASNGLIAQGWRLVDAGSCKMLGTFGRGMLYVMAKVNNDRRGWYGEDAKFCVESPGPFKRAVSRNYACPSNGSMAGFQAIDVDDSKYTWTLNKAPSFSEEEFFALQVCNRTAGDASIAVIGRKTPGADWTANGWWKVNHGSCSNIGRYAKGKLYATATEYAGPKGWFGNDSQQCVEFPGPFERAPPGTDCPSNGKIVGFHEFNVADSSYTWSLNGDPAFGGHEFFDFEVCNKSRLQATVALMGREDPSSLFVVQGWRAVAPSACENIGRFARGVFYAMASVAGNITRGWFDSDIRLCVELPPGPFKRANSDGYKCRRNERLVSFRKFLVTGAKLSWALSAEAK